MQASTVTHMDSAHPINTKIATLAQDVKRRLMNLDDECPVEVNREELEKFTTKLLVSGYSKKLAAKIVRNGVDAYRRLCDQVKAGQRPLHRLASKGVI